MVLENLVLVVENFTDSAFCKKYIDYLEDKKETFTQPDRLFEQRALTDSAGFAVCDLMSEAIGLYQKKCSVFNFNETPVTLEFPVIKKYSVNANHRFDEHIDVGDLTSSSRFLAVLFYLNTVETGGETVFTQLGKTIKPKQGSVLIFPPYWMFKHCGNPPVSNDKYIITSYFRYGEN